MSWGGHGRRGGLFCGVMSRTYKNPSLLQSYINIAFLLFAVLISRFRRCNVACIAKCSRILLLWCRKVMCVVMCLHYSVYILYHERCCVCLMTAPSSTVMKPTNHSYAGCTYTEDVGIRTKADPALILGIMHRKVHYHLMLCVLGTNEY